MVEQRPDRVLLSSPKDLLISIGDGVIIEAEVVDARGNPIPGAPIAWRSSPAFIAKVDQNGLVTAVSNGTTTIDVTSGGASGTQKIKVQQRATSVAMQSTRDTLWAGWPPTPFSATGIGANGNLIRRPSLTWQSSDPTVALVDDTGLVTPVAPGEVILRLLLTGLRQPRTCSFSDMVLMMGPIGGPYIWEGTGEQIDFLEFKNSLRTIS